MVVSHIHRRSRSVARCRPARPRWAQVEHIFAEQKHRIGLFVRTVGLARATTKIGLANLVHNMRRLLWLERQKALT
jgi:IS5 family transposase